MKKGKKTLCVLAMASALMIPALSIGASAAQASTQLGNGYIIYVSCSRSGANVDGAGWMNYQTMGVSLYVTAKSNTGTTYSGANSGSGTVTKRVSVPAGQTATQGYAKSSTSIGGGGDAEIWA